MVVAKEIQTSADSLAPSDYKSQLDFVSDENGGPSKELKDYLIAHK